MLFNTGRKRNKELKEGNKKKNARNIERKNKNKYKNKEANDQTERKK